MNLKSLTFSEDFNDFHSSPDGSRGWMTTYTFGGMTSRTLPGNDELEYYSDPSVGGNPFSISGGVLSITASLAVAGSNPYRLPYDSGVITTNKSLYQLYGYFEVRAELPAGRGFWPAFWMLPVSGDYAAELDVFEILGDSPTTLYETVKAPTDAVGQTLNVPDLSAGFHTYGVDWEPDFLTFYLDGQAVLQTPTPAAMSEPMYMLLNLAVGGPNSWPGAPDAATPFPSAFKIDYVRAYATAGTLSVGGTQALPAASLATVALPSLSPIGAPVTVGSGADQFTLLLSEDPYHGNAQFTVSIDGVQIGPTLTATVLRSSGGNQVFSVRGDFGAGSHTVTVNLLNHTFGGTPDTDRDLYLNGLLFNGTAIPGGRLALLSPGAQFVSLPIAAPVATPGAGSVVVGQGADAIALFISEDAFRGDAQFTISVDGVTIGGAQTATVSHASGTSQVFTIRGDFGSGAHVVSINFLNDFYGGSPAADRNLYLDGASFNGAMAGNARLALMSQGAQFLTVDASPALTAPTRTAPAGDAAGPLASAPAVTASLPAVAQPTFRFFDTVNGTQFLTSSATERDTLLGNPAFTYEGHGMNAVVLGTGDPDAAPVFRFFNTQNGTHFFTLDPTERGSILATRPDLVEEPANFAEHLRPQAGDTAVYRFFDSHSGDHFFTQSATEHATISATRPDMIDEGIAFWAPGQV